MKAIPITHKDDLIDLQWIEEEANSIWVDYFLISVDLFLQPVKDSLIVLFVHISVDVLIWVDYFIIWVDVLLNPVVVVQILFACDRDWLFIIQGLFWKAKVPPEQVMIIDLQ